MNRKIILTILQSAAITVIAALCYAFVLKPLAIFEIPILKTQDFLSQIRHRLSLKPKVLDQIVLVSIDNESVAKLKERWPFKRSVYAELIARLDSANPKLIALDFVFAGKSTPDEDFLLAESIRKSGKVFLASFVDPDGNYIPPLKNIEESAKGSGIVNKLVDQDQTVRRIGLFYADENKKLVSWPWEIRVAADLLGLDVEQYDRVDGKMFFPFKNGAREYFIPKYPSGRMMINFRAAAADMKKIPLWKILETENWKPEISGKVVLIGATSKMIHDEYSTPLGLVPGIVINVNAIQNFLDRDFLRELPGWIGLLVLAISIFLAGVFAIYFDIFTALFLMALWTLIWAVVAYSLFAKNYLPDVLTPIIFEWAVFLSIGFYRYLRTIFENLQLRRKAATDPLTGLANRRTLETRLDEELVKLAQSQTRRKTDFEDELSVLMIDIDNFKKINDTLGHPVGDDVIKNVAYAIQSNVRADDLGARYGGEEFCVVLPHTTKVEALRIAEKIRQTVEEKKLNYVNQLTPVSISVGVAASREDGLPASRSLVRAADQALYDAKHSGKNRVSFFRPGIEK